MNPYFCSRIKLGYGVKAAQQILILFVKVRILVTQQKRTDDLSSFFVLYIHQFTLSLLLLPYPHFHWAFVSAAWQQ